MLVVIRPVSAIDRSPAATPATRQSLRNLYASKEKNQKEGLYSFRCAALYMSTIPVVTGARDGLQMSAHFAESREGGPHAPTTGRKASFGI